MTATYTLPGVLLSGIHSARPAASAVAKGALYAETDTGQTFQSDGASTWTAWGPAALANPMTTPADLIVGGTSGTPARLAKGSDGQVLTVDPSTHLLVWATPASGFADPTTTKGDLIAHGTTTTRLPVGSDGQALMADSTQALGVKWATPAAGGADAVQVASGAGAVRIPGLAGSADIPPGGAADMEFDTATLGGFAIGSPDTINANTDLKSALRIYKASTGGFSLHGRGWTLASLGISMPFTMTMRLLDQSLGASYQATDLLVAEGSPGKLSGFAYGSTAGYFLQPNVGYSIWTNATSRATWGGDILRVATLPLYMRLVVASSTSVTSFISAGGHSWMQISSWNPGFTIGAVAVTVTGNDNSVAIDSYIDWIRFS